MTEKEFIAKYIVDGLGPDWTSTADALYWARSYKMPQAELFEISKDFLSISDAWLDNGIFSSSVYKAKEVVAQHTGPCPPREVIEPGWVACKEGTKIPIDFVSASGSDGDVDYIDDALHVFSGRNAEHFDIYYRTSDGKLHECDSESAVTDFPDETYWESEV